MALNFKFLKSILNYMYICLSLSGYGFTHECSGYSGLKRILDPLQLKLQVTEVDAGNQAQNSTCI